MPRSSTGFSGAMLNLTERDIKRIASDCTDMLKASYVDRAIEAGGALAGQSTRSEIAAYAAATVIYETGMTLTTRSVEWLTEATQEHVRSFINHHGIDRFGMPTDVERLLYAASRKYFNLERHNRWNLQKAMNDCRRIRAGAALETPPLIRNLKGHFNLLSHAFDKFSANKSIMDGQRYYYAGMSYGAHLLNPDERAYIDPLLFDITCSTWGNAQTFFRAAGCDPDEVLDLGRTVCESSSLRKHETPWIAYCTRDDYQFLDRVVTQHSERRSSPIPEEFVRFNPSCSTTTAIRIIEQLRGRDPAVRAAVMGYLMEHPNHSETLKANIASNAFRFENFLNDINVVPAEVGLGLVGMLEFTGDIWNEARRYVRQSGPMPNVKAEERMVLSEARRIYLEQNERVESILTGQSVSRYVPKAEREPAVEAEIRHEGGRSIEF